MSNDDNFQIEHAEDEYEGENTEEEFVVERPTPEVNKHSVGRQRNPLPKRNLKELSSGKNHLNDETDYDEEEEEEEELSGEYTDEDEEFEKQANEEIDGEYSDYDSEEGTDGKFVDDENDADIDSAKILKNDGAEIKEMKKLFQKIDTDKNGTIEIDELKRIFRCYGLILSKTENEKLMNAADKNKDGKIQFSEFRDFIHNNVPSLLQPAHEKRALLIREMKTLFKLFDKDGDGIITLIELKYVLRKISKRSLADEDIEKLLRAVDVDNSNQIDFEEFQKMVKKNAYLSSIFDELIKPTPLDYLRGFIGLPKSFRSSLLSQVKREGINTTSNFVTPRLASNGISYGNVRIDCNGLLPMFVATYEMKLIEAIGIPLPESPVLSRKAYMCLYNGTNFIGNVFEIEAKKKTSRDDYWSFSTDKIIIRTSSVAVNLSIYVELVIVVNSSRKINSVTREVSCGWIKIKLAKGMYLKTIFKDFKENLTGGTLVDPENIDPNDIKSRRKDLMGNLMVTLMGKPTPTIMLNVTQVDKKKDNIKYQYLPPNIITCSNSVSILELYRKEVSRRLLLKVDPNEKHRVLYDPMLKMLPKIMEKFDIWNEFLSQWNSYIKKVKKISEKKKILELKKFVIERYSLLECVSVPDSDYANYHSSRVTYIQSFMTNPKSSIVNNYFTPFDVNELLLKSQ